MNRSSLLQKAAGACSRSFVFKRGRKLWEENCRSWTYPMSKWDKLWCGGYIILNDFAAGVFPPRFEDQAEAYENEINYNTSLPGTDFAEVQRSHATKPFWGAAPCTRYLNHFNRIYRILQEHGINPGHRLLEIGCGSGWMAEMLAIAGYSVTGTTISHHDVALANKKVEALKCKELKASLEFHECPMESVDRVDGFRGAFDAAFVYEALHHAYDWRMALRATAATLKDRGWLLLASEPNRLHTCISYRVARLSRTHEIGFSKRDLLRGLETAGFSPVTVIQPRIDDWISQHWIMARKS